MSDNVANEYLDPPNLKRRGRNNGSGSSIITRLPPHSQESEQCTLGSLLVDKNTIGTCVELLREGAEVFYDLRHQIIYQTIVDLWNDQDATDVVTVYARLQAFSQAEQCGGLNYLSSLTDTVTSVINLESWIGIIREKYLLRRMITVCTDTVGKLYDNEGDVEKVLDECERDVLRVNESRVNTNTPEIKTLVGEALREMEASIGRNGEVNGLRTGFVDLDRMTGGLQPQDMIVIAGRPSTGKTSLCMNIAEYVAIDLKLPVGVFSLEMSGRQLVRRMVCSRARVNSRAVQDGYLANRDIPKLTLSAGKISSAPLYIDDTGGMSILQVRAKGRRWWQQYGIKLAIIDYLQLMNALGGKRRYENRQQEVTEIAHGVKELAKELNIPVIVLSQLNREFEKEKDRMPRMSDLRESGCLSVSTTKLFTSDGVLYNIDSLMNTYSLNKNGSVSVRSSKNIQKPSKPMVRVVLRSGRFIDCTPNHPILTDLGFIAANKITSDHSIAVVRKLDSPEGVIPIKESKWIGWMLGNGSMVGYSSPSFICSDAEVSKAFCEETKSIFGLTPKVHRHSCQSVFQYDITAGPVRTSAGNPCKDWLKHHNLWDRRSYEKRIPDWFVTSADDDSIANLVSGMWETDGTVTRGTLKYSTTSNELAWQMVWCLCRLGIFCYIDNGYMSTRAKHLCYTVLIADGRDVERFRQTIPMIGVKRDRLNTLKLSTRGSNHGDRLGVWVGDEIKKQMVIHGITYKAASYRPQGKRISQDDLSKVMKSVPWLSHLKHLISPNIFWDKLDRIEKISDGIVFDREVINGPHNFVANGIIVHNSIEQAADIIGFLYKPKQDEDEGERSDSDDVIPTNLLIAKFRNGPTGNIPLTFLKAFTRFESAAKISNSDEPITYQTSLV